jgi:hypothetical protein
MTLAEAIQEAVATNNAEACGRIAELLRFRGMDYAGTYELVHKLTGIELPEWDSLLYETEINRG